VHYSEFKSQREKVERPFSRGQELYNVLRVGAAARALAVDIVVRVVSAGLGAGHVNLVGAAAVEEAIVLLAVNLK
jgi:hypothetical protein